MDPAYQQKLDRYKETFFGAKLPQHLPVIIELTDIGCCPRCAFRHTNLRTLEIYQEKSEVFIMCFIVIVLFYCFY